MSALLSSVGSFGWFTDGGGTDLLAVSSFGWWFDDALGIPPDEIVTVSLCLTRRMQFCLRR